MRHRSIKSSHFHLPFQLVLGIVFFLSGGILLAKALGFDFAPFIPESIVLYICALGSFLGGFYLIVTKLFAPRVHFRT